MPLAGIGSRFIALLVDTLIWMAAAAGALAWCPSSSLPGIGAFSRLSAQWAVAIYVSRLFLLNWGYFTLFEAFWNGRTPGKRVAGIRVIQRSGRAIGAVRVDGPQLHPVCGPDSLFLCGRRHRHVCDPPAPAAGRPGGRNPGGPRSRAGERRSGASRGRAHLLLRRFRRARRPRSRTRPLCCRPTGIAKLSAADLEVLEGFFARRLDLSLATREALAQRIAGAIQAKSGLEPPAGASVETFLEAAARQLRDLARMQ